MPEQQLGITKQSFDLAHTEAKLSMLFDMALTTNTELIEIRRIVKRNLIIDKFYLGLCGFLGGLATWFIK